MTSETIKRILGGEFQEVHVCLRAGERVVSKWQVVGVRFTNSGDHRHFDVNRRIELTATTSGSDGNVYFETADCEPVLIFPVSNFMDDLGGSSSNCYMGQEYGLSPC